MSITVRFFASLREDVGVGELVLSADTLTELLSALAEELGDKVANLQQENVRVAVNQVLVDDLSSALQPGDEVAFLPPVTGG